MTHSTVQCRPERHQQAYQMEWKPVVGEDNDKEDQVDTQVQHVCQELEIKHIDSLQSNIADIRVATVGGVKVVQQGRRCLLWLPSQPCTKSSCTHNKPMLTLFSHLPSM